MDVFDISYKVELLTRDAAFNASITGESSSALHFSFTRR